MIKASRANQASTSEQPHEEAMKIDKLQSQINMLLARVNEIEIKVEELKSKNE